MGHLENFNLCCTFILDNIGTFRALCALKFYLISVLRIVDESMMMFKIFFIRLTDIKEFSLTHRMILRFTSGVTSSFLPSGSLTRIDLNLLQVDCYI